MQKPSFYSLLILITIISACNSGKTEIEPWHPEKDNLISLVRMDSDTLLLVNNDYILDVSTIDSVTTTDAGVNISLSINKLTTVITNQSLKNNSLLTATLHQGQQAFSIPIFFAKKQKIELQFTDKSNKVKTVQLKGEMNAWNPQGTDFNKQNNVFTTHIYLKPGSYQYLLVVDGKEMTDPGNTKIISNNMGGANSLIEIPDYDNKKPLITTRAYTTDKIELALNNNAKNWVVLWQNEQIAPGGWQIEGKTIKITLPKKAAQKQRSFIRVFASNQFGLSNDVLVPLEYGQVLNSIGQITRRDKHANVMYFLMVDRFNNGTTLNDFPLNTPEVHPRADYHGGDLLGVLEKINDGYFEQLGCNTIWLSPIVQNPSTPYGLWPKPRTKFSGFHGYWPISSTKIDYHFGADSSLHSIIENAHAKNMNVLLDYVANHVHQDHPLMQLHPDWKTDLYLPDGTLNTELWDEQRLTTWFDTFLPSLDFSKPEVVDAISDSAIYWIEKFGIDGFRHDATKHIQLEFWRALTSKIKTTVDFPFYQIGETYGSRPLINSYINTGMLDAQFDFNVYDDAVATFSLPELSFEGLSAGLKESHKYYGEHNLMGYITGNQDRGRVISYASGDLKFEENAKLAGWTREITITDSSAFDKVLQLFAFNFTIPGIPCIYYGDEIGLPGGNDPDNRKMMRFENLSVKEKELRNKVSQLGQLRNNSLALIYGDFNEKMLTEFTWVYQRSYFNETALVAFNKSSEKQLVKIPIGDNKILDKQLFNSEYQSTGDSMTILLPPLSCDILIFKKQ